MSIATELDLSVLGPYVTILYIYIYIWALIVCYYEIDCMFTEHPDKLIVLSAESDVLTSQNQLSQTGRLTLQGLCRW